MANATFDMMLFSNSTKINQQYSKLNQQIAIRPIPNRTSIILMRSTFKNSIINCVNLYEILTVSLVYQRYNKNDPI